MEGVKNNQPEAIALLGPEPRLRLHRLLTLTVPDSKVKTAVQVIMDANRTDAPGDGKNICTAYHGSTQYSYG